MARGSATVESEDDQAVMFPDLDMDKPQHKALLRAAKAFAKAKSDRAELLSTAKEKQDAKEEALIALMHETKITKFRHGSVKAELIETREKAEVKLDDDQVADDEGEPE